jgi:hypothetical protein
MVLQFQTRHVTQKNMLENLEIKSEFEKFETADNRLQCHQIVAPLCGQFLNKKFSSFNKILTRIRK